MAGISWNRWLASTGIGGWHRLEYAGFEQIVAHPHRVRRFEPAVAIVHGEVGCISEPLFEAFVGLPHHRVLASLDSLQSVSETSGICSSIPAIAGRRWASGRPVDEQAGAPDAAFEGVGTGQTAAVREAPPPRRDSGLPVRWLRCFVASVVVPAIALVTKRLSP